MRALTFVVAPALVLAAFPAALQAQAVDPQPRPAGPPATTGARWSVSVGVAPVLGPAWQGSKRTALSIFPDVRVNYGDILFASVPDGIGWNAIRTDDWRAGPLVKLRFGRNERNGGSPFLVGGGSDDLRGLGDVGAAAELGGFVETRFGPQRRWRARVEVRRGLGGGHDGVLVDLSLAHSIRASDFLLTIGPRANFASRDFTRPYFGIDASQSLRSGLAFYDPGGGLLSAGIAGSLVRPLNRRSVVTLFAGIDQLGAEAGRSPLVRERGRRLQAAVGIGYGYRFAL